MFFFFLFERLCDFFIWVLNGLKNYDWIFIEYNIFYNNIYYIYIDICIKL